MITHAGVNEGKLSNMEIASFNKLIPEIDTSNNDPVTRKKIPAKDIESIFFLPEGIQAIKNNTGFENIETKDKIYLLSNIKGHVLGIIEKDTNTLLWYSGESAYSDNVYVYYKISLTEVPESLTLFKNALIFFNDTTDIIRKELKLKARNELLESYQILIKNVLEMDIPPEQKINEINRVIGNN